MQLLVRNRVKDFDIWYNVFMEDEARGAEYGLKLVSLWRSLDDPNNVFFLMEIESVARTQAFMAAPESQQAGERSGVIDGEFYFIENYPT